MGGEEHLQHGGIEVRRRFGHVGHAVLGREPEDGGHVAELHVEVDQHHPAGWTRPRPTARLLAMVVLPVPPLGDRTVITRVVSTGNACCSARASVARRRAVSSDGAVERTSQGLVVGIGGARRRAHRHAARLPRGPGVGSASSTTQSSGRSRSKAWAMRERQLRRKVGAEADDLDTGLGAGVDHLGGVDPEVLVLPALSWLAVTFRAGPRDGARRRRWVRRRRCDSLRLRVPGRTHCSGVTIWVPPSGALDRSRWTSQTVPNSEA